MANAKNTHPLERWLKRRNRTQTQAAADMNIPVSNLNRAISGGGAQCSKRVAMAVEVYTNGAVTASVMLNAPPSPRDGKFGRPKLKSAALVVGRARAGSVRPASA